MSLIAYYPCEINTASSTFIDRQGNYNGTMTSMTISSESIRGNSIYFTGSGTSISIASLSFSEGAEWSINLWVKEPTSYHTQASLWGGAGSIGGSLYYLTDGIRFLGASLVFSISVSDRTSWNNMGLTYDNGEIYFFLNNMKYGPYSETLTSNFSRMGEVLPAFYFKGHMDEIRVYDNAITDQEMFWLGKSKIVGLIKEKKHKAFRRLYMRRRLSGGEYETDWQEIPREKIITYGSIKYSVDDVKPDFYKTSALKFSVSNSDGYFSDVSDDKSFFYSALTRHRTLVKLEAGYEADDGTEYPTDPSLFIGFLSEDMTYRQDGKTSFNTKHLSDIFKAFPADLIDGLYSDAGGGILASKTLTAKEIVELVRDHEDSNNVAIFQKYISLTAWNITSSAKFYNLDTTTNLQGTDVWKLMQKLAGAEQQVLYIDGSGGFNFLERDEISSSPSYHFSGVGDTDKTYGHNLIGVDVDENIRKVYNRIRVKYRPDDTVTSYKIRNETWDYGDSSSSFMHGVRTYEMKNVFMISQTASTVADEIYAEFKWPKDNYTIRSKFVPQILTQDRISVTYKLKRYTGEALWNWFNWGEAVWGERFGYNILLDDVNARVTVVEHNIDNFTSTIIAREI